MSLLPYALLCAGAAVPAATARHYVRRHGWGPLLWRWCSGHAMDGQYRTDATWTQRGTRVLHHSGNAIWWHWLPRLHRAGIRFGVAALTLAIAYGLAVARAATIASLAATAAAGILLLAVHAVYRLRHWKHERHYVRPLERTVTKAVGAAPVSLEVERAGGKITSVAIEWAPAAEIGAPEQHAALEAVTARLAIEAPDAEWKLKGRSRSVVFTQSEPPPSYVQWEDVAVAVQAAAPGELVFGVGKRGAINTAAYSESPHLAIPGGSGGGKSNLAAFLLLQEMVRGSLIVNLDPKWISHLWLQDLPNVINAHDIPDLHLALCWLGKELLRRTKAAYYSAGGTGRVRGSVGSRIIVLAEELNYGMPGLKDYWREIRGKQDPKQSPAVSGLSALAVAGRASDMHEWLIAQLLTVASTGVSDSTIRTNAGVKAMARHDPPGWAMAVGKHIPMPPPSTIPGRIHLVTGDGVRETQVPYLHLDDADTEVAEQAVAWARALAVSGTVAQIPAGPEGVPQELWPTSVVRRPRLAIEAGQETQTKTVPAFLTIAEAVDAGIFGELDLAAARKRVQRARLANTGRRGDGSYTYAREDLFTAARDARKKEPAA